MARILTDREVVLAKYGDTPTKDDVVTLSEYASLSPKVKSIEVNELGRGLGSTKSYPIADWTTIEGSLVAFLRAGLPPKLADLYKMCGLEEEDEKDDDGNIIKVHFYPAETPITAGNLIVYQDDLRRDVVGVAGNLKISFQVGAIVKATFDIKGFTDAEPVSEDNPNVTLDNNELFTVESISAITIGGNTLEVESVDFDMGVNINEIYAIGAKEYQITDYKPTLTIKNYADKNNQTHWADIKNGNVRAISIVLTTTGGSKLTFIANACKLTDVTESDNNKNLEESRTYLLEKDDNGKNFEIVYE
jgi:hypothetical protein